MKRLIVLNHQPTVPPFMLSALKVAIKRFDEVVYVNSSTPINYKDVPNYKSICFVSPSKLRKALSYVVAFMKMLSYKVLNMMIVGLKNKGFSVRYLKIVFSHLYYYCSTKGVVNSFLDKKENYSCYLLSVWFSSEAFCAAEIKKHNPQIKAISLAHSFEVFVSRDPYIEYNFNDTKIKYLDAVYFISKQGLDSYLHNVKIKDNNNRYKCRVMYLGSFKEDKSMNQISEGNYNICTCSRTIPLKRLDILCDALASWNEGNIVWTHIGEGIDDERIQKAAAKIMESNKNVTIIFKGHLSNNEVKEYYITNPIDLFVNISSIEGIPISIMEALSFGIPVIATDVGGTREIVSDEVGILLPDEITPSLVKNALLGYYKLAEEVKQKYRHDAFIKWKTLFDAEKNFNVMYDDMLLN